MTVYRFPTNTNRPPLASNQTVRGVSDADVRVVLKVSDPDQDPLSVRVITAPTRGRLSTAAPTMTYVPAPGFIGTDRFTYRVSDGSSESATATVTIVIDPRGAFIERDGQVVVEAEHPHRRIAGRGAASASVWTRVTDVAGYSGSAALRALANAGVNTGTAPDGPRLDYDIQFTTPGTYHLWLRLQGASDADDSVLVGLDGAVARLDPTGLRAPGNTWQWSNAGADRRRYTVCVTTPGVHTFNVWMREDGVAFDKVLLTTSATTVPAGIGSAESRFLPASNHPPVAVIHSDVVAGRAPLRVAFSSAGARDPEGGAITVRWLFGGGAGASGPSATRTFTTPGIYRPTVIVTDAVGAIGVATTTVVVLPPAGPIVESDGIIVIEAEDLDRQTSGSGSAADAFWLPTRSLAGFTGHGAAQALPNTGINTGTAITGPRLDYQLQVDRPGTYYLWIRMQGATGNDDSVHLGLNGQLVTAGGQGVTPATFGSWQWSNRIAGAGVVRVTIPAAGRHVLNLWMREDGVAVDRLMLTTDPAFRPACTGPAANPRLPQGSG
jgi:PKD repeat protein